MARQPPVVKWDSSLYFITRTSDLLPVSEETGVVDVVLLRKLERLMG